MNLLGSAKILGQHFFLRLNYYNGMIETSTMSSVFYVLILSFVVDFTFFIVCCCIIGAINYVTKKLINQFMASYLMDNINVLQLLVKVDVEESFERHSHC